MAMKEKHGPPVGPNTPGGAAGWSRMFQRMQSPLVPQDPKMRKKKRR